jgi:hypothetical protein
MRISTFLPLLALVDIVLGLAQQTPPPGFTLSNHLSSNNLTSFSTYLSQFPSLLEQLNAGNLTGIFQAAKTKEFTNS